MVNIVFTVTTRKGLANLERSLINIAPDLVGNRVLCLVQGEPQLYVDCRQSIKEKIDKCETLVVYVEEDEHLFRKADEYLDKGDFVFVSNENVILPKRCVSRLANHYIERRGAGFYAGHFVEYETTYWVSDIYNDKPERIKWKDQQGLVEVDTAIPFAMVTRLKTFKELFCQAELGDFGPLSYGIRLRRQGYINYVDFDVRISYGGKQ